MWTCTTVCETLPSPVWGWASSISNTYYTDTMILKFGHMFVWTFFIVSFAYSKVCRNFVLFTLYIVQHSNWFVIPMKLKVSETWRCFIIYYCCLQMLLSNTALGRTKKIWIGIEWNRPASDLWWWCEFTQWNINTIKWTGTVLDTSRTRPCVAVAQCG
jgi:hypothetical protein